MIFFVGGYVFYILCILPELSEVDRVCESFDVKKNQQGMPFITERDLHFLPGREQSIQRHVFDIVAFLSK